MSNDTDLRILIDLFQAIGHFGERQVVQRQLIISVTVVIIAWVIATLVWYFAIHNLTIWSDNNLPLRRARLVGLFTIFLKSALFPSLVLIGLNQGIQRFAAETSRHGLLDRFILLIWIIFAYRLAVGIVYVILGSAQARRYRYPEKFCPCLAGVSRGQNLSGQL